MSVRALQNFVNGVFVDSSSGKSMEVHNPSNGAVIATVPLSNAADIDVAVKHAQAAFGTWSGFTIKQRASVMFKFHNLVNVHSQELAELIVLENGKNITEALADVAKGNETAEWATSLPQVAVGRTLEVSKGIQCQEVRNPLGVVGAIVPFNFPAMVPMWTVPIALTMGNCVILKPSEKVPLTMARMAELFVQAGMPAGVFQIINGAADVVNGICEHPGISGVTFVGSSKVAEIVFNKCNSLNKRVLALGGAKNHLIALPDCDTAMAARDITASFAGCAGQRCMAASALILVDDGSGAADALLAEVVAVASKLTAGSAAGQVGPLIDDLSKDRVMKYITEAESRDGAAVLVDGRTWAATHTKGSWVGPTILLHKSCTDAAMLDEIFGPVLSVFKVSSWDEAIAIENANPYGNAACVYTERGANAEWFIKRFRASMLGVNIGIPVPREPFSFGGLYGTKSKYGSYDVTGDGAMEFFSNRIKVTSKWSASYGSSASAVGAPAAKKQLTATVDDKANFDGRM